MKEKWKNLLQAMIAPIIVVLFVIYGYSQVYDAMTNESSAGVSPKEGPIVQLSLYVVIAISICTLIFGTLMFYLIIVASKKKKGKT